MHITKLGHCCLLIEENGLRILTDPGIFTVAKHQELRNINVVLFTHEHPDHYHLGSLKKIIANNPQIVVLSNPSVGALLSGEGIAHTIVADGQTTEERGVLIEGYGSVHGVLHLSLPVVQNTGYFIAERLWYPGDSFTDPGKRAKVMALPVAGPWMKLSEAIDYCAAQKPELCFPVHDGLLNDTFLSFGSIYKVPAAVLEPRGIQFSVFELDKEYSFN